MKHKWLFLVVPLVVVFIVVEGFLLKLDLSRINQGTGNSNAFPIMRITLNGTDLDEIHANSKEIKYEGNDLELVVGDETLSFTDVQIKGRGNSTWDWDKRPYQIKFKNKVDLLGLGPRKKYILLANAYDDSMIRNALMFKMTEMIEEKYRVKGEFVELDIDGGYLGLYYLTTKVEIGKNSVDLRDKYGILVELDTMRRDDEDCVVTSFNECLVVKDAVFEDDEEILAEATEDFLHNYNKLESAAKKGDFNKVKKYIDVQSFAEYYLIFEFAVNPDAFVSSFFYYKNGKDDVIHAGPLWDYDFAFSNRGWSDSIDKSFYSPTDTVIWKKRAYSGRKANTDISKLLFYLMDIPEFRAEVERVFQDKLSGRKSELLMWTIQEGARIKNVAMKDSERWGKNELVFYSEMKYLLDWLSKRYDYIEEEYGEKEWQYTPGVI